MKHVATNSTVCSTDWQLVSNRGNPSMSLREGHQICVTRFSPCALISATASSPILIKRTTDCQNLRYFIIHFVILLHFILKEPGWVDAMEEIVYDAQLIRIEFIKQNFLLIPFSCLLLFSFAVYEYSISKIFIIYICMYIFTYICIRICIYIYMCQWVQPRFVCIYLL